MSNIDTIRTKVEAGDRLTFDDGLFLEEQADLFTLGELANLVRERKNGNFAYYNVNTHINPTNVCVYRCNFCAFRADLKSPKGYVMTDEQIVERAAQAVERGATEMHIVGGLHHQLPYEWYLNVVRIIHEANPRLHLKAWTGVEWDWFARLTNRSTRESWPSSSEAGLGSLPGGGAEIFHPEVRDQICEHKADADAWLDIHREAHELGLRSNATMLYGHIENAYHRIDHLCRLRELQDETGGFQTFIPLAFHPDNTVLGELKKIAKAERDARSADHGRQPADARQLRPHQGLLDHARHQDGPGCPELRRRRHRRHRRPREDLSRRRLRFAAGDHGGRACKLIEEAGRVPIERDTLYHEVVRSDGGWRGQEAEFGDCFEESRLSLRERTLASSAIGVSAGCTVKRKSSFAP